MSNNKEQIPKEAQVVIIGGGIIGVSVAYHLGHLGCEVVLLEKDELTSGTTWHAAGLMCTFGSLSETSTRLRQYTRNLYENLEAETELSTGFKPIGFVEVAATKDYLKLHRRVAEFNRHLGVDVHEISPTEIKKLFPLARVDDILAGFYVPSDGRVNPVDATMSLAKGARQMGAKIIQKCMVTGILKNNNRVTGVRTNKGDIKAEVVVNCAGMWARQLGGVDGIIIPNQAAEHYYFITEEIEDMPKDMPILEDPSRYTYIREEMKGFMIGLFEPEFAAWKVEGIPNDLTYIEIPPDMDRMIPHLQNAMSRVPITENLGIKTFFCGPESFTPDLGLIFGEAPELKNYFVAAGANSVGIIIGPGIGRALAHWIVEGTPDIDITGINIERFRPYQCNPEYLGPVIEESAGNIYKVPYPTRRLKTGRDIFHTPFHKRLKEQGACFKQLGDGSESPEYYVPEGKKLDEKLSWDHTESFPYWEAEHNACRNDVIIMDMSFMSKFFVKGEDAKQLLGNLSTNDVETENQKIAYTLWLNEKGLIVADVTVIKHRNDSFTVIACDTMHRVVETWMKGHIKDNWDVTITDMTQEYCELNLQGPKSRDLLQKLTTADLSNEEFPYRTARVIKIGSVSVLCVRISYLGELGYELYMAKGQALDVYDQIVAEGTQFNLGHAGLKSLASTRIEKAYRYYGADVDNTDNPYEVGLEAFVKLDRDFIGRDACEKIKAQGTPKRRLVQVLGLDPEPMLYHAEVVYRNSIAVGYVRSASYGHTLGGAVGLAMIEDEVPIDKDYLQKGSWEVDIAGVRYPASVSLKPMHDPEGKKLKT